MEGESLRALSRRVCAGLGLALAVGLLGPASHALAQDRQFEFAVPRDDERNTLWRVDTLSGEVGMCFFAKDRKHPLGVMACLERGPGAGVQSQPGPFGLVASNRDDERGMFRVNWRTGTMSLCYEIDDRKGHRIVCTEPNR